MSDIEPVGLGFIAHQHEQTYAAALGPGPDDVILFSEESREGFAQTGGYWRRQVRRGDLEWLVLLRTVGAFGGEPCVVLDEDDDGLHIAYTGHSGLKAEALGYWMVDHGAYEVVVPHEEVHSIRVERIPIPLSTDPGRECLWYVTQAPVLSRERPTFAEIFAAHYSAMVRLAGLLGADDPEDIAQEAFARLHLRQARLRDDGAAVPYLRSIVCNLTRNRIRHLRLVRLRRPEPPPPERSSEQAFLITERHRDLLEAVGRLSRRQREALVLRYWLDLSEREIADAMGVSPGSVKSHTSRAIAALGRALEENDD